MLGEHRQIGGAAQDGLEHPQHTLQHEVRRLGTGRHLQDQGDELGHAVAAAPAQSLARSRVAQRLQPPESSVRILEAGLRELSPIMRIIRRPTPDGGEGLLLVLLLRVGGSEDPVELPLDTAPVPLEHREEAVPVPEAHGTSEAQAPFLVFREQMGLFVLPGLEPVLHQAQVLVGIVELPRRVVRQQLLLAEQAKDGPDGADLQVWIAPAADELERLTDKLDLADAAGTELDVVRHALALKLLVDHLLHVAQRLDGAEVQVAPVDERAQHGRELGARVSVAAHHPRLDHGVALPLPGLGLVVVLHGAEAHGQWSRVAEGAQARVDAKNEAVRGVGVQGLYQASGQADEELLIGQGTRAIGLAAGRISKDEVDVRGKVELARPQLAHPQHHETLRDAVRIAGRANFGNGPDVEQVEGAVDTCVG